MKFIRSHNKGFTLVELLVVISIIGLLSTIATVSLSSARTKGKAARVAGDLRQIAQTLDLYLNDNSAYPCHDHTQIDTTEKAWAAPYMSWPRAPWGGANPQYHWENGLNGFTYSISMFAAGTETANAIDKLIDDNNLATGIIRGNGTRLEYGGMDQSIPFVNLHCP